jgi:hypothetical protein
MIKITGSPALSLSQWKEKIFVIYDGSVLMEKSAYDLYQTSRTERMQKAIAIRQALAQWYGKIKGWFSGLWTSIKVELNHLFIVEPSIVITNNTNFDIRVSDAGINARPLKPQETTRYYFSQFPSNDFIIEFSPFRWMDKQVLDLESYKNQASSHNSDELFINITGYRETNDPLWRKKQWSAHRLKGR